MCVILQALNFEEGHIWHEIDKGKDDDENHDYYSLEDFLVPCALHEFERIVKIINLDELTISVNVS